MARERQRSISVWWLWCRVSTEKQAWMVASIGAQGTLESYGLDLQEI